MNKPITFSFIGGDLRQMRAATMLASDGFYIRIFGIDTPSHDLPKNITFSASAEDCTRAADAIVLPLPYSSDGGIHINTPLFNSPIETSSIFSSAGENTVIFAGKSDYTLEKLVRKTGAHIIDYAKREEFAIMNAIPTAEGAISIAINNTPHMLKDSNCLVIGYGRIGKILSAQLLSLGANVTATARKYSDLAWISANGCTPVKTSEIFKTAGEYDIIFNTVPEHILDFRVLSATKGDVLIIDLASKPGGVDFEVADALGRRVMWALSLPGKVAPDTAGKIIKDTLLNILEELGV